MTRAAEERTVPSRASSASRTSRPSFTPKEILQGQLEPIHAVASNLLLFRLLPAIEVAWADGVIQEDERETILRFAEENGLAEDARAMERVTRWLETPPSPEETAEAIRELRRLGKSAADGEVDRVVEWAEAVAKASGGVFGVGSVSPEERRRLAWLENALSGKVDREAGLPPDAAPRLAAFEIMRDFLVDRLNADTQHVDKVPEGELGMWPQPSPWGADRMAPAVLGVPEWEYAEYMEVIVGRYVRSLKDGFWDTVKLAAASPGVLPLTPRELGEVAFGAPFSRFLCPALGAADEARFGSAIAEAARIGVPHKIDQSHIEGCDPLPGLHLAPTVGLFAVTPEKAVPIAIEVNGRLFRPGDGEPWVRASYFLLQGISISVVLGAHPHLHFPMDSVIGVSREALPEHHPIARLVEAHAYLQLPLNYGVVFNARSVAHNHQQEIYTPFPVRRDDVFGRFIGEYYAGVPGNAAYPGFRYPMDAPSFPGPYCAFLRRYYDVVLAFVREILAPLPAEDPAVRRWGATLHALLPGFPPPEALTDPETRARAIAGFIHTVSIWHSTDHHTYGEWPVSRIPQRLRVPPPGGPDDAPIPLERYVRCVDVVRQELARRMFYEAHTVRPMLEARYGFTGPRELAAVAAFHDALRACDREQPIRYLALDRIACSLQF